MKKPMKKLLVLGLLVSSLCLGGCSNATPSSTSIPVVSDKVAVTYIANETMVYSSTAEVVNAVADSVVEISTESVTTQWGRQYIVSGAGSGVIISKADNDYYIITNNHVIEDAREIEVKTRDGVSYDAVIVATDDSEDIGIVRITTTDTLTQATWGNSDTLQVGEDLIAIGNPLGSLGGTVTKGILSAKGRTIIIDNYAMTLLQTDTAINPGNSGGGLFNMRGQLVGIVNAKKAAEEIEGICFAIPGNRAKDVYENLLENGYLKGRAYFNIVVSSGTLDNQEIAYITNVNGAEADTFKQYDRIRSINGEEITSILSYNIALSHLTVGEKATIQVNRGSYQTSMWGGRITFSDDITTFEATILQYGE